MTRTIQLGADGSGALVVTTSAVVHPSSGLLISSERSATTTMNKETRHARETWTLDRA